MISGHHGHQGGCLSYDLTPTPLLKEMGPGDEAFSESFYITVAIGHFTVLEVIILMVILGYVEF